jgi:hypothetical protein
MRAPGVLKHAGSSCRTLIASISRMSYELSFLMSSAACPMDRSNAALIEATKSPPIRWRTERKSGKASWGWRAGTVRGRKCRTTKHQLSGIGV